MFTNHDILRAEALFFLWSDTLVQLYYVTSCYGVQVFLVSTDLTEGANLEYISFIENNFTTDA